MNEESDYTAVVSFKFLRWGEWMKKGSLIVLRNRQTGRLSGAGKII